MHWGKETQNALHEATHFQPTQINVAPLRKWQKPQKPEEISSPTLFCTIQFFSKMNSIQEMKVTG